MQTIPLRFGASIIVIVALASVCFPDVSLGQEPGPRTAIIDAAADGYVSSIYPDFSEWKTACDRLPSNRTLRSALPPKELLPLKRFSELAEVIEAFFRLCEQGPLARTEAWLGRAPAQSQFFNTGTAYYLESSVPFQPFVQRQLVPPGAEVLFHGDFHGDIHSLIAWIDWLNQNGYLRGFEITRPNVYLAFLGDYTDRGAFGVEVLYTLLRLKLANPDRVLLVRGNHEDVSLVARYGFLAEAFGKFGRDFDHKQVVRLYDFLPVAIYLGCGANALQCNHGGMEPGFDPRRLLDANETVQFQFLGPLRQRQILKDPALALSRLDANSRRLAEAVWTDFLPVSPTEPKVIGFMWNDFSILSSEPQFRVDPDRAFVYGGEATRILLEHFSGATRKLRGVMRAHQHSSILNPMMRRLLASRGIFQHWQPSDSRGLLKSSPEILSRYLDHSEVRRLQSNSVWTFNVSPDSVYGQGCDYRFDTFGILTTSVEFEDWILRVVNLTIAK